MIFFINPIQLRLFSDFLAGFSIRFFQQISCSFHASDIAVYSSDTRLAHSL